MLVVTIQSFADTIHFFFKNGTRHHGPRGLLVRREHSGHQAEDAVELVGGVGAQIGDDRVGCAGGDKQPALRGVSGRLVDVPDHAGRDHGVALAGHDEQAPREAGEEFPGGFPTAIPADSSNRGRPILIVLIFHLSEASSWSAEDLPP